MSNKRIIGLFKQLFYEKTKLYTLKGYNMRNNEFLMGLYRMLVFRALPEIKKKVQKNNEN